MMDQPSSEFPSPPVEPSPEEPMLEAEPATRWPMTVGIISIVLGALGLLCYGCNSGSTLITPMMVSSIPEDQRPPTPQGVQLIMQIVQMCVSFLLSLWLLIGGIGLTGRRGWARGTCLGWAWVKILFTALSTAISLVLLDDIVKQINDQLARQPGGAPFTFTREMMLGIMLIGLIWMLIWPVFMIAWLSRGRIRDECALWADRARMMI
jgi:hypothetical protein